jgi:hypothetical protein
VETNYTVTIGDCMMLLKIPAKIVNIVARHWKLEYLNWSSRPLLDNGLVTRFPVSLSGWQINTFTQQHMHKQTVS